jgi:hypothetical protein
MAGFWAVPQCLPEVSYYCSLARHSTVLRFKPDRVMCALQHELLQRLAPVLEEAMHLFDCCAAPSSDRRLPSGAGRTLPLSRRASAASHEDLHRLVDQVCAQVPAELRDQAVP